MTAARPGAGHRQRGGESVRGPGPADPDAQILSNTQLEQQLASHPAKIQNEIIRINTDARHIALQIALLIPILAGGPGLLNSFRMRLPDPCLPGPLKVRSWAGSRSFDD